MKKILLATFIGMLTGVTISFSEQEFIKVPKEKKFYPSCQQYVELDADIIDLVNTMLVNLVNIQKTAIKEVKGYVDGVKDCFLNSATKKQRSDAYVKLLKIKNELQEMMERLIAIDI